MGFRIPWLWSLHFFYIVGISFATQMCDDEDLDCDEEASGDFEASGSYGTELTIDKDIRTFTEEPSTGVMDLFTGRKFLAAVVSGSCVGLLLASMAMMLVLCKARRDNSLRRYNYQQGTKNEIFA